MIRKLIKKTLFRSHAIWNFSHKMRRLICRKGRALIDNNGLARLKQDVNGYGNRIRIMDGARLYDTQIVMHGDNNEIVFDCDVIVGPECSFWIEGNNSFIHIGKGTTFTCKVHFNVQEDNMHIKVGEGCMFSNTIIVRTSDSHPIYNAYDERINLPRCIDIGNHVWVAPNSKIMKGVTIGNGSIIGSDTMVTKSIPSNVLAVGHPAKVVKEDISWSRESLFKTF